MQTSVNVLPQLTAKVRRLKNKTTTLIHQAARQATRKAEAAKHNRQELEKTVATLLQSSKQLGHSVSSLRRSVAELQPKLADLRLDLDRWQRLNKEPLSRINNCLKKFQTSSHH